MSWLLTARSFITGSWKWLAAIVACSALAWLHGCSQGKKIERADQLEAELGAIQVGIESAGIATQEREQDDERISTEENDREEAIEAANDSGAPSGAAVALGCERLRQARRDISKLPACAGHEARAEAAASRGDSD